ncbi:MAG: hypothetical protein WAW11_02810 [Patescibacteria group bacterium]
MKVLYLNIVNKQGASWIAFEKEDTLPFDLPAGTIFEDVTGFRGVVENPYYICKENKFVTNIRFENVENFQLKKLFGQLLEGGWKVLCKDDHLMAKDGCNM